MDEVKPEQRITVAYSELVQILHETQCFDQWHGRYVHSDDINVVKRCEEIARGIFAKA